MMVHWFLANLWALLLAFMLAMYVILDGFDLGIGILSLFSSSPRIRGIMIKSISAIWDANETWLVLAGGTLFGAFPIVYSVALNALYIPLSLMLFGFIFRAVSFEFRGQSKYKRFWELAFGIGSLCAAAGQGFVLGGIMTEIKIGPHGFAGGMWDWFDLLIGNGDDSRRIRICNDRRIISYCKNTGRYSSLYSGSNDCFVNTYVHTDYDYFNNDAFHFRSIRP